MSVGSIKDLYLGDDFRQYGIQFCSCIILDVIAKWIHKDKCNMRIDIKVPRRALLRYRIIGR